MKKVIAIGLTVLSLVGCADATRTVPVLVLDERTISGDVTDRPKIVVPTDQTYLPPPNYKDPVLAEYNKNNFIGPVKSAPLPPPRPADLGKPQRGQIR